MDRRELFSSLASSKEQKQESLIRPPYYKEIDSFLKGCNTCNKECATSCEENIIIIKEDGTPTIDFSKGGCTYCDDCAKSCPNEVLSVEYKRVIDVKVEIDILKCMSWHNTMCFSCKDPCLDDAIKFLGMFRPSIDEKLCTNCGFCLNICPSDAIKIINKRS
ncbi:ferredoxin-type protein NapF [Halarcobacter ebronensis]|uniref:Ferredoxin n=1 Tax=Halarcobacter ebronensis TaxID=1462615 RepID=A0A4Q1AHE8_9BACT|nr:ferredoxin-type protein NapF [Halarcobacter ebronensis]QKF82671.1 ferredoxin-type protein [Halarcobacter ebronensis]RXK02093.1 ferredoxin [Halarcobacter ebronensis]